MDPTTRKQKHAPQAEPERMIESIHEMLELFGSLSKKHFIPSRKDKNSFEKAFRGMLGQASWGVNVSEAFEEALAQFRLERAH